MSQKIREQNNTKRFAGKAAAHVPKIKQIFQVLLVCLTVVFVWRFRQPLMTALKTSVSVGWPILFLPTLFLVWNAFATRGWLRLIQATSQGSKPSFWNLYVIRVQSQSLNLIVPLFGLGGEALRSAKISGEHGLKNSIICVASDKFVDILAEAALALTGAVAAVKFLPHPTLTLFLSVGSMAAIVAGFAYWQSLWTGVVKLWPIRHGKDVIMALSQNRELSRASRKAFLNHLIEHCLMAGEILLVSRLIGINMGIREILIVNGVSSVFNLLFVFIPGRIGAYECSLAFAFHLLSIPPTAGISVALIRRARQVLVCAAGILLMVAQRDKPRRMRSGPIPSELAQSQGCVTLDSL